MKKILLTILTILVVITFNLFCTNKLSKNRTKKDFSFFVEPPLLNGDQKAFIQRNFCKIFIKIPEPHEYYIADVFTIKNRIAVKVVPLNMLQSGANKEKTQIVFTSGKEWIIYFDDKEDIISVEEK